MLRGLQGIVKAVEVNGGGQAAAPGQIEAVGPSSVVYQVNLTFRSIEEGSLIVFGHEA